MKEYYITITGMSHYYDMKPFKIGKRLKCIKEPDNDYDDEAIKVVLKHIGTVGYVANSVYTVIKGTKSAGYIRLSSDRRYLSRCGKDWLYSCRGYGCCHLLHAVSFKACG